MPDERKEIVTAARLGEIEGRAHRSDCASHRLSDDLPYEAGHPFDFYAKPLPFYCDCGVDDNHARTDLPAVARSYREAVELLREPKDLHTRECAFIKTEFGTAALVHDCDCVCGRRRAFVAAYDGEANG